MAMDAGVKTGKVKFSQQQMKRHNTMLLFNLVRKHAPISRIMLAEKTGLSATTVSQLVEELIHARLIKEKGVAKTNIPGRRPIMLEVNAEGGCFIVLELLSGGFICSLYDLDVNLIDKRKYKREEILKDGAMPYEAIRAMLYAYAVPPERFLGIGILYPGVIDRVHNKFLMSTVLDTSSYLTDGELSRIKEAWGADKLFIMNTSVVSAYSEHLLNPKIKDASIIEISIEEGVGAGVVVLDKQGNAVRSYQLEIGHMVLERGGKPCKCGNFGCFEALCNTASVINEVNRAAALSLPYEEEFRAEANMESLKRIMLEIENGNAPVIRVIDDVADMIKTVIINTLNMVDAEYVFLTGLMSEVLKGAYKNAIQKSVNRFNNVRNNRCKIRISKLDFEKKRQGAVNMMIDTLFAARS